MIEYSIIRIIIRFLLVKMSEKYISPGIFNNKLILSAVSTRNGGVSKTPYSSLNMGKSTSDSLEDVLKNREVFFSDLGINEEECALSYQVHGCDILNANSPIKTTGFDALITNKRGLFLVVSIADCVPVLIHEEEKNIVAAIHSGWKGTADKILSKTIQKMRDDYGANPKKMKIFIGPCISQNYFEVDKNVADNFSGEVKFFNNEKGKYFIDLKRDNQLQALSFNIHPENIEVSPLCTFKDEGLFFSHRRDKGVTGRMIAVIGLR